MPFAGYKNFADCVRKNKDKSDPEAYCGYIKHKVEDKESENIGGPSTAAMENPESKGLESKENLKGAKPSENPEVASRNPNEILGVDNKPLPKQRPEETNVLNNEPLTPIVNQDPPVVEKPVVNVMSAGLTQGVIGAEGAKNSAGPLGMKPEKDKPTFALSGTLEPEKRGEKLTQTGETGGAANVDTAHQQTSDKDHDQGHNAGMGAGQSLGASTSEENPIHERTGGFETIEIKGTGHNQKVNPIEEGLNKVLTPDTSNEDTYNQNKRRKESLSESENDPSKVKPPEQKPPETPPSTPQTPEMVPIEKVRLVEAQLTIANSAITEKDAKIAVHEKTIGEKTARITELEGAVTKLQTNATTTEAQKKAEYEKGKKEGKEEVISKVSSVLPNNNLISGFRTGPARVLADDVKKKLYECEHTI